MAQLRERSVRHWFVLVAMLGLTAGACGGDDDASGDGGDGDGDGGGGEVDAGDGGDGCDPAPCLDPPAEGFQIRNQGTTIQPQEDVEYCEVVLLPGDASDTYYVNRFESQMTTGSHHLIVAAVEPGSDTDAQAEPGARVKCFGPASGFGGDLVDVTGQQLPYHEESFPAGVGRIYNGGQKLIFNYHYLNTGDSPIEARAAVNFHTTSEENVQKVAESAGFYFFGIRVDIGDTAEYISSCTFTQDVMVHKLTRHTHQWGTDFVVEWVGGANDGQEIYTSPNYEDPDFTFDEPVLVKAGEGFRWTCNYLNDSDHRLTFGEKASDEMCILFSTIYSPDAREVVGDESCARYIPE